MGDVVSGDLEQIWFDPVGELGGEVDLAFGDIHVVLVRIPHVVTIGTILAVGVLDLLANDVVSECAAFGSLDRDACAETFAVTVLPDGIEHTVSLVILLERHFTSHLVKPTLDTIERRGGLCESVLGIGGVVVMRGDDVVAGGGILFDLELAGFAVPLGKDGHFKRGGLERVEVGEERLADLAVFPVDWLGAGT